MKESSNDEIVKVLKRIENKLREIHLDQQLYIQNMSNVKVGWRFKIKIPEISERARLIIASILCASSATVGFLWLLHANGFV